METHRPPPVVPRPLLARWMFERNLSLKDGAEALGVGAEQVRRYCLPFDNALRAVPPKRVMERVRIWTNGLVTADSFYPPIDAADRARAQAVPEDVQ